VTTYIYLLNGRVYTTNRKPKTYNEYFAFADPTSRVAYSNTVSTTVFQRKPSVEPENFISEVAHKTNASKKLLRVFLEKTYPKIKYIKVSKEEYEKAYVYCIDHMVRLYEVLSTTDKHVFCDNDRYFCLKQRLYQCGGFVGKPKICVDYYVSIPLFIAVFLS